MLKSHIRTTRRRSQEQAIPTGRPDYVPRRVTSSGKRNPRLRSQQQGTPAGGRNPQSTIRNPKSS